MNAKTIVDEVYEEFIKETTGMNLPAQPIDAFFVAQRAVRRAANTVIVRHDGEDAYTEDLKDRGII